MVLVTLEHVALGLRHRHAPAAAAARAREGQQRHVRGERVGLELAAPRSAAAARAPSRAASSRASAGGGRCAACAPTCRACAARSASPTSRAARARNLWRRFTSLFGSLRVCLTSVLRRFAGLGARRRRRAWPPRSRPCPRRAWPAARRGRRPGAPDHANAATVTGPMTAAVKTKTTELPDSRVRVEVEVPTEALERELKTAASQLGREMRVPGFRSGKVPPEVVLQQVGREAVLDEAVRRGLPGWYEEALADAGIQTVGDPQVDLNDLPEKGSPLAFTIEVGVVPPAELGEYKGVEVGRREPKVDDQEVQAELERIRESLASLETVERDGGRRRLRRHGLRRVDRRDSLRGRRGPRAGRGARLRPADPGLRGAARGSVSGRGAHRRAHLPGRLPGRGARGQGRLVRRGGEGGQGEAPAGARRRLRGRGRRL